MTVYNSLDAITETGAAGKAASVALGLFDGLHLGHRAVIQAALDTAARLSLTPAVFTFSIDNSRPAAKPGTGQLLSRGMRERLLGDMGISVLLSPPFEEFRGLTPAEFVEVILRGRLGATHVFCGENFHFGKNAAGNVAVLTQLGGRLGIEVHTLPLVTADGAVVSSTRIRECVAAGDMPVAARLLGRPFAIDFEVIHGRRLGRTLNSPTINQPLPPWFAVPRYGVYASLATVDGVRHASVTNVGVKPTVGSDAPLAETYIHDFDGDLYGRRILVEFLEFIRPERKFASVEELRGQIHRDSAAADEIARRYDA